MSTPQHYRDVARAAVTDVRQQAPVLGYLRLGSAQHVYLFQAMDDAHAWFNQRHQSPDGYDYVAVFVAADLHAPVVEDFGGAVVSGCFGPPVGNDQVEDEVGHWFLPLALGVPAGAYAGYRYRKWQEDHPGKMVPWVSGDDDDDDDVDVGTYPWVSIQDLGPPRFMPYGPWLNIIGDDAARRHAWPTVRALIRSAIDEVHASMHDHPAPAFVWCLESHGGTQIVPLESYDQAIAYARDRNRSGDCAAVASFDRSSPHWPNPVSWYKSDDPSYEGVIAEQLARHGGTTVSGGPWVDMIGADPHVGEALDVLRRQAKAAAEELPARVIGAARNGAGNWQIKQFKSVDDADDWFGSVTRDPSSFTYACYFDKNDPMYPVPLNETIGTAKSTGRVAA